MCILAVPVLHSKAVKWPGLCHAWKRGMAFAGGMAVTARRCLSWMTERQLAEPGRRGCAAAPRRTCVTQGAQTEGSNAPETL
jgi:hypothetical protein